MSMGQGTQGDMEEDKFVRAVGKWILRIAGLILSINLICRAVDAEKSTKYIQVVGKVTKTQTTEHWVRAGGVRLRHRLIMCG